MFAMAHAALPRAVGRAFVEHGVPLGSVAVVVQRAGEARPLLAHQADKPMNPASVMKLVTTFAALDLLGADHRWTTEAYLDGPLVDGRLQGDLVLKGGGDPKITVEQWQALIGQLRAKGLAEIDGDLVLDRSRFRLPSFDPGLFDGEPSRPYNVGPDALLVNFKSVRLVVGPNRSGDGVAIRVEPPLEAVSIGALPALMPGICPADWRKALGASFANRGDATSLDFYGIYPAMCGEREFNVAVLDHPHYVHAMFATFFREAGGRFSGAVREGRAPADAPPFAKLESPPLGEIVRDVNKFSNNVMARELFLALADASAPATPQAASRQVRRWFAARKLPARGFAIENGSGLSRNERITARALARLLAGADRSAVSAQFESSLAVAAIDGTLAHRFQDGAVAGHALLKTGSLEGVRALAGYVLDARGERWIVAAIVNHPNAADALPALDNLVQWVYRDAALYRRPRN